MSATRQIKRTLSRNPNATIAELRTALGELEQKNDDLLQLSTLLLHTLAQFEFYDGLMPKVGFNEQGLKKLWPIVQPLIAEFKKEFPEAVHKSIQHGDENTVSG